MTSTDDPLYEQAASEVKTRKVVQALWARALAEAGGDPQKTVAQYIALRVERLRAEQSGHTEAASSAPPSSRRPSAWIIRRLLARVIDLALALAFLMVLFSVFVALIPEFGDWYLAMDDELRGLLMLAIAMALDGIASIMFGATPGKLLLGLRVLRQDGAKPKDEIFLFRALHVWLQGLAIGLPFLSIITVAVQLGFCLRTGRTLYDWMLKLQVTAVPLTPARMLASASAMLVSLAGLIILIVAGSHP